MKMMAVTGLSNEQDFTSGKSAFILILNHQIRIPISEDLANQIIQHMYQDDPGTPEEHQENTSSKSSFEDEEDDGIDQI